MIKTSEADIFALREFLKRHYGNTSEYYSAKQHASVVDIFAGDHYTFSYVHKQRESLQFELRRSAIFRSYDLLQFSYRKGSITLEKGELRDELDDMQVRDITSLLKERCYKDLISNLDDIKIPE